MSNIEFIEKEIAITKSKYKEHLKFNQTAFAIKDEEKITALQQIKSELESREVIYYILFEQAEDGYYGDFVIGNKLYSEDEAKTYIQIHAQRIYDEENGVECYFKAESINTRGEGVFYFRKFKTNEI